MAQFGAKRPRFAPVATTPENALPTYNFESVVTIGKKPPPALPIGGFDT